MDEDLEFLCLQMKNEAFAAIDRFLKSAEAGGQDAIAAYSCVAGLSSEIFMSTVGTISLRTGEETLEELLGKFVAAVRKRFPARMAAFKRAWDVSDDRAG